MPSAFAAFGVGRVAIGKRNCFNLGMKGSKSRAGHDLLSIGMTRMRLGGRLAAAIEVLEDIGRRHRPVADALKDWGLSHRFAGGGDRAAIGNIVYDALRRKRSAGWLLGADTPRAIGFGALLLEWGQTAQSLNDALDGDKFAPPLLERRRAAGARRPPA